MRWGGVLLKIPLLAYCKGLSPLLGPRCRFYPSCSNYALKALELYGPLQGSWLAFRRLLRCHPFHPGGVDFVPTRESPLPEKADKLSKGKAACLPHKD
ncbi:MAG: membrane protein insertion efficiency factor YidD [Cystobacterineae bacterium]|nr:membrane protein insertion efficiency factor YidD [Cystobacterineae bacterium]